MLRCCWSDNSVSEELRRVSAATLEGCGRATTDARGVETGRGKEPGQATQRPGDAIEAMREATIDTPRGRRACFCVDASSFGWAYCVVRHWVARSGLGDSLGAGGVGSVGVVDWVAGYDTSCRARAQEAIGRAEFGQRRRAKRGLVENVPQSAPSLYQPGNHCLSAGHSAMNVQSAACGPCDGMDSIWTGAWGWDGDAVD